MQSIYINFNPRSYSALSEKYAQAVQAEIALSAPIFKQPIETVFISYKAGRAGCYKWLLDTSGTLRKTVKYAKNTEITLEIGQNLVSIKEIKQWLDAGITRVVVRYEHDSTQARSNLACTVTRIAAYIENVAVDLYRGDASLLAVLVTLPVVHISLYCLDGFKGMRAMLMAHGFGMYEWQHYARDGFSSLHAQRCWMRKPYWGFGLGAHSFDGESRMMNSPDMDQYCNRIDDGQSACIATEHLTESQVYAETVMTAIRMPEGVAYTQLSDYSREAVKPYSAQGFLQADDHGVAYTVRGFLVENQILTTIL